MHDLVDLAIPSNPVANLTAENWVDLIAQTAADFVFGKGFVNVMAYLKQIDAMSKISRQARKAGEILIHGVDAHLKDNPLFITAEGIVLKMSKHTKDIDGLIKSSKALLESAYAKIAVGLGEEIKTIQKLYPKLPNGFAEFVHKPIKVAYEHILGMVIDQTKKGKLALGGFHHDLKNAIEKSDILNFTNKIFNEHGCYSAKIFHQGEYVKTITFFPAHWSREQVVAKILEAYNDFKKSGAIPELTRQGKYKIRGFTSEGIEVEMYFTIGGEMKTAYPVVK